MVICVLQRRRFLEEALNSLTVNVAKKMAESVKTLCSEAVTMNGEDVTEQEEAIAVIEEYVDDMDHAIGELHTVILLSLKSITILIIQFYEKRNLLS